MTHVYRIIEGLDGQMTVGIEADGLRVSVHVATSTPGASDGLGEPEPVLIVWGEPTAPFARVALRSRLVARGWEPFAVPEPA